MKIYQILEHRRDPDFDDDAEPVGDPDQDRVPHIVMQVKKALDSEGRLPLKFQDGSVKRLDHEALVQFARVYTDLRPQEKSELIDQAAASERGFRHAIERDWSRPQPDRIRGSRYMTHFPGDLDQ